MIQLQEQGVVRVISSDEPLNQDNLERLCQLLTGCIEQGQPLVVLDFHDVPLIDSAGLELVLTTDERFRQRGGALKVAALNELCHDAMRITGLLQHVESYEQVKQAVCSFLK